MKMRMIYAPAVDEHIEMFGVVPDRFDTLAGNGYSSDRQMHDREYYITMQEMASYAREYCNGFGIGGYYWFNTEKDRLAFIMKFM